MLVNIPFDYSSESEDGVVPEENNLVREFAFAYSTGGVSPNRFIDNPDLYQSPHMEDGIINGGNWYVITGSLQDWSYIETGCLDLTVEVAKRTPKTEDGAIEVFNYNRDGIIAYIQKAGHGVYGRVTDGSNPISGVEIKLTNPSEGDIIVKTDAEGYYHRILLSGDYTLSFVKSGYVAVSIGVSLTVSDPDTQRNIELRTE